MALSVLVRPTGLEPVTPCLGGACSVLLSYGRMVGAMGFEPMLALDQTADYESATLTAT